MALQITTLTKISDFSEFIINYRGHASFVITTAGISTCYVCTYFHKKREHGQADNARSGQIESTCKWVFVFSDGGRLPGLRRRNASVCCPRAQIFAARGSQH